MPAATGADATPPQSPSRKASSPVSGASPSALLKLKAKEATINEGVKGKPPVKVVPKAKAQRKAAAKAGPKAKAESKPAAKANPKAKAESKAAANAGPKKVTNRKPASATQSSASASSGPLRKPAAARSASSAKGKKHVIKEIASLPAKVFKQNKLSGFDKMADICKPVIRKRAHEETENEEEVDSEDEEGEEEEGLNDDAVVNPDTFAPESMKLDRCKKKKFDQLMESGSLPAKVTAMYSAALTLKTGKRDRVRDIINSAIDRSMDGKLALNTCKPIFSQTEAFKCSKHAMFICVTHTWLTYLKCYWSLLAISRGMH